MSTEIRPYKVITDSKQLYEYSEKLNLKHEVIDLLFKYHIKKLKFDCGRLIYVYIKHKLPPKKSSINYKNPEIETFDINSLIPGNVIFMTDIQNINYHYAIYLGNELFLSKHGANKTEDINSEYGRAIVTELSISDLNYMKIKHKCNLVYKVEKLK